MAVARIRTSDPEVVEFLSRHLASSGYQLEFVRPGEPVSGEADLEIDASRMDLESAMAAARQEAGLVTILSGVLRADTRRDIFEEAAQTPASHEYAEVSPYARGAELQDEPSALHKTANAIVNGVNAAATSIGNSTKAVSERFQAWRTHRAAKQEQRQAEEVARRRADEERRRAEEERLAAIRREETARMQAEEHRRREEQAQVEAETARLRMEEQRRAQAEAQRVRAEQERRMQEQARLQAEAEERRQQEALAATGIERQRQEEARLEQESQRRQAEPQPSQEPVQEPTPVEPHADAQQDQPLVEAPAAAAEGSAAEPEPQWTEAVVPAASWHEPMLVTPTMEYSDRRRRPRRMVPSRERVFKRSAVAAAIVSLAVIAVWSLGAIRRPANPLSQQQLMRSAAVEQQRPFGPASTVAPVMKPEPAQPVPQRRAISKKPTPRGRVARPHATETTHVAKRNSSDEGRSDVVVHHFASQKQETAKIKMKNGVKIISESD